MNESYKYDLFISYIRQPPVLTWLNHFFGPTLEERIRGELPYDPKIFVDIDSIKKGLKWSGEIKEALKRSKVLVTIWSADYFRSSWCTAEWQSMEKRQELLNQEYKKNYTIIFPIKFGDGEHFHKDAQKTQMEDLSNWNYTAEGFRKSEKFMEFEKKVEDIAKTLSKMILEVPVWNPHWPVYSPGSEKVKKIISECKRKSEKNFKKPRM